MATIVKRDENGDVDREKTWSFEERRLRRREVYAQELMAVAVIVEDVDLDVVRQSPAFQRLVARLKGEPNASAPDSAAP